MATRRRQEEPSRRRRPPATTPEGRENQLIGMAVELAERQLAEGTASSQVITHYLKLGTSRERLEQEKLQHENELLKAKKEALASQARVEELYMNALTAMRGYQGQPIEVEGEYDND
jgi:hypothetical protein